jgi:hypothetical protein
MVVSENEHLHADTMALFVRVSISAVCFQHNFPQKQRYLNDLCALPAWCIAFHLNSEVNGYLVREVTRAQVTCCTAVWWNCGMKLQEG